jgi:hypothetical protein
MTDVSNVYLSGSDPTHLADASVWVKSAFSPSKNPTRLNTELNAYQIQFNVQNALQIMHTPPGMIPNGGWLQFGNGRLSWNQGDTFRMITPDLLQKIKQNYNDSNSRAFKKGGVLEP